MNEEYKDKTVESKDVGMTDDVTLEELSSDGEEFTQADILKKLREKIKLLEKEKQEYLDLSQRTRADYANFKKEVESNRLSERKYATKRFIEDLIPVLDAYDGARSNQSAWEAVDQNWRIGIEYIFGQLSGILEKEGITRYGVVGDIFDPLLHETLESVAVSSEENHGKIVKVLQGGYKMYDSVLRPARVHVGNFDSR